jgi:hypothetical protein
LIVGGTPLQPSRYKAASIQSYDIAADDAVQRLISEHQVMLSAARTLKITFPPQGFMSSNLVQANVHHFVEYGLRLQHLTEELESYLYAIDNTTRELQQVPKSPFQVIPQLTMKVRFLNIGKEQMAELMVRLFIQKFKPCSSSPIFRLSMIVPRGTSKRRKQPSSLRKQQSSLLRFH